MTTTETSSMDAQKEKDREEHELRSDRKRRRSVPKSRASSPPSIEALQNPSSTKDAFTCEYDKPLPGLTIIEPHLGDVVLNNLFHMIRGVTEANEIFKPRCMGDAYMWSPKLIAKEDLDDLDKSFLEKKEGVWHTKSFLGYHTMGGYYGFFRPDLCEVIHLVYDWWKDSHPTAKRLYVCTIPYPDPTDCMKGYLASPRRHAGQTYVWFQTNTENTSAEPLPFDVWEQQTSNWKKLLGK